MYAISCCWNGVGGGDGVRLTGGAIAGAKAWSGEVVVKDTKGRETLLEVTLSPVLDANGKLEHVIGVYHDITALKLNEHRLIEERHKAEAAMRAKAVIITIHDWEATDNIVRTVRALSPKITIIARARDADQQPRDITVLDRIGGGDGFVLLFHGGLLSPVGPRSAARPNCPERGGPRLDDMISNELSKSIQKQKNSR